MCMCMYTSTPHAGSVTDAIVAIRRLPMILGHEGAGVVAAVGLGVRSVRVGDAVYGVALKRPMGQFWTEQSGWCADYAVATEDLLLAKPAHLSFEEAASLLGSTLTAMQITRAAMALNPAAFPHQSLEGKRALVTAGLGAATSIACQVLKNVYGASEVITTVSTAKVRLVGELMPGVVDRVVDYQTQDVVGEVGRGQVDFLYNSRPGLGHYLPLMEPRQGVIAAILAIPPSRELRAAMGSEFVPLWFCCMLDLAQAWYWWKLWGTGVRLAFVSGNPGLREDFERAGEVIATRQVRAVTTVVALEDLETVKQRCEEVRTLKGAVGKLVIKLV